MLGLPGLHNSTLKSLLNVYVKLLIYTCLWNKAKFLLHIIFSLNIWHQKPGFSLSGTMFFSTAHRIRVPLFYCHFIALFSAQIQWNTVPLEKHFELWALSLKSKRGRDWFTPSDAAERSDPWAVLPHSVAFWNVFRDLCLSLEECLN